MEIVIIAQDEKKELMTEFCIAYYATLSKHHLCSTGTTGKIITEATGLPIETLLPGEGGGVQQIASRISYDEVDLVFFFRNSSLENEYNEFDLALIRLCDTYNVPIATNIATAEALVLALGRGDLDWRLNMKSTK
ncbi:MAG: methylglyoxal synthase [Clostridia bacterium]|nr:methylglyoxal synthase [Clostridia bacterium]